MQQILIPVVACKVSVSELTFDPSTSEIFAGGTLWMIDGVIENDCDTIANTRIR